MAIGIPEFDLVLEASRHLQETRVRRMNLLEELKILESEEEFWQTELCLRLQRLDAATSAETIPPSSHFSS